MNITQTGKMSDFPTLTKLKSLRVVDLKEKLASLGLSTGGKIKNLEQNTIFFETFISQINFVVV